MNELMRKLLFLPEQSSSFAQEVDGLHYFVITVTMLGALLVTVVGGFYLLKYRRGARMKPAFGGDALPGTGGIPLSAELAVVFGLLGLFVLWWYIGYGQFARMRVPPQQTFNVYVTAKQWMWNFAYPNGAGSSGTLYVPARTPIKLIMTSRDVIHSFFVPEFRQKMDVLPGRYTTLWFEAKEPGTYPILCTEYCGLSHSMMRGEVVVVEPREWVRGEPDVARGLLPAAASAEQRRRVLAQGPPLAVVGERAAVEYGCLRCHTIDGTPHIGPSFAGLFGSRVPLERGRPIVADEAYLTESMMDPLARIHRGFQPVMPTYFGVLPATETAAIVEYIKSLSDVPRTGPGPVFMPEPGEAVPAPAVPEAQVQPTVPAEEARPGTPPFAPPRNAEPEP